MKILTLITSISCFIASASFFLTTNIQYGSLFCGILICATAHYFIQWLEDNRYHNLKDAFDNLICVIQVTDGTPHDITVFNDIHKAEESFLTIVKELRSQYYPDGCELIEQEFADILSNGNYMVIDEISCSSDADSEECTCVEHSVHITNVNHV